MEIRKEGILLEEVILLMGILLIIVIVAGLHFNDLASRKVQADQRCAAAQEQIVALLALRNAK